MQNEKFCFLSFCFWNKDLISLVLASIVIHIERSFDFDLAHSSRARDYDTMAGRGTIYINSSNGVSFEDW